MSFCEKCGTQAEDGDVHCVSCGQKLRTTTTKVEPVGVESVAPVVPSPSPPTSHPRIRETQVPTMSRDETLRELRGKTGFNTKIMEDQVHVDIVFPRTPADLAGLLRDDVIVQVGDGSVKSMSDFVTAIQAIDLGQLFTLAVARGQESVVLRVDPNARRPIEKPLVSRTAPTSSTAIRQQATRRMNGPSSSGSLILGIILVGAGIYFGTYANRYLDCAFANGIGGNQPVSCSWYQTAYSFRDWCIGVGAVFVLAPLVDLLVVRPQRK